MMINIAVLVRLTLKRVAILRMVRARWYAYGVAIAKADGKFGVGSEKPENATLTP